MDRKIMAGAVLLIALIVGGLVQFVVVFNSGFETPLPNHEVKLSHVNTTEDRIFLNFSGGDRIDFQNTSIVIQSTQGSKITMDSESTTAVARPPSTLVIQTQEPATLHVVPESGGRIEPYQSDSVKGSFNLSDSGSVDSIVFTYEKDNSTLVKITPG
jgi:hypothetical protein